MILPEDLNHTDGHVRARQDGDTLVAGISDCAQEQPGCGLCGASEVGSHFYGHEEFGSIGSVKARNVLSMPAPGEIVEVNSVLEHAPELVSAACHGKCRVARIKADAPAGPCRTPWPIAPC